MNNFRLNVIAYLKLLIYKCSGLKIQLREPIYKYFQYANPQIEEISDNLDILTLNFGKEVVKLKISYLIRPKLVKRRNYDSDEVYEYSIDGMVEHFVDNIE